MASAVHHNPTSMTTQHTPYANMSNSDVVIMAMQALQSAASIIPANSREDGFSDDEHNDGPQTAPVFVQKLKDLVDDPQVDSVVWSKDGASFVIHEPKRLSVQLPKYFKSSKLKSFVRQLHFYGFKKSGGSRYEDWVYNHKYFQSHGRLIHRLRRKTCGPDQQIKTLQSKVTNLQDSLAETQQKLGDMAMALVTLLQQQNAATCLGSSRAREAPAGSANTPFLPTKRARSNNNTSIAKFEQNTQPVAATEVRKQRSSLTNPSPMRVTVKQEPTRNVPSMLSFTETLGRPTNGGLMLTPHIFDLDTFVDETEDLLFSPGKGEDQMFAEVDRGLSLVRVTA